MTHIVSGFVARPEVLRARSAHLRSAYVATLEQGFGLLPVTGELYEETGATAAYEQLQWLTDELARLGAAMSRGGAAAYVETDYHGGTGEQGAMAWHDGALVSAPVRARDAVARVLAWVGVESSEHYDEVEALGLDRHADNDDWVRQAGIDDAVPPGC